MLDRVRVLESLAALRKRDKARQLFGAASHRYRLNRPVDPAELRTFEQRHGIALPEDYRFFITEIGNGGAGPYYGLFRFGEHDDGHGLTSWGEGGMLGDVWQPFKHCDAWNLPEQFWAEAPKDLTDGGTDRWDEWAAQKEALYFETSLMNGAIPICHLGCAIRHWLVVNGEEKGHVWADDRAHDNGIYPVADAAGQRMSFGEWYMSWLNEALERFGVVA